MRSVILTCLVILLTSCAAKAGEIPSAASGAYVAPDRLCRLVLSRLGPYNIAVDFLCVTDAGVPTSSRTVIEAWTGRCVGSAYTAKVFALSGSNPLAGFVALDSFGGSALYVRRAIDPNTLSNGGGVAETWILARPLASPSPYTCGARFGAGRKP